MEVKDILKLAIIFLDKKELFEDEIFLETLPTGYASSEKRKQDINQLLLCFNLIYNEIARDYMPLLQKEEIEFINDKFNYSDLEKVLLDVVSLKSNGRNVKFKMYPTYFCAKTKKAIIEYSYEPDNLGINDQIENFGGRIPARVFAYGFAMEYSFLSSQSTEALIWEQRYKESLLANTRKKSEIVLPSRRWIWCLMKKNCC